MLKTSLFSIRKDKKFPVASRDDIGKCDVDSKNVDTFYPNILSTNFWMFFSLDGLLKCVNEFVVTNLSLNVGISIYVI